MNSFFVLLVGLELERSSFVVVYMDSSVFSMFFVFGRHITCMNKTSFISFISFMCMRKFSIFLS